MKTPFFQFNPKGLPRKQRAKLWYVFRALKGPRFFTFALTPNGRIVLTAQNRGHYFRQLTIGKRGGILHKGRYTKPAKWLKA